MRYARFVAILLFTAFSTAAWAQSDTPSTQADAQEPDMQADTIEGQNSGASAQYEMSSEDGQTSDDVDAGEGDAPMSESELKDGTLQQERSQDQNEYQNQEKTHSTSP